MEIKTKEISKSEIEITCEMTWDEFKPYIDRAFSSLSKGVVVKGFREGKAPKDLLEKQIGEQNIMGEAVDQAIREKYLEIIKEKGLEPIGPPKADVLKLAKNNPFSFKVTFQVLPEIELPDYAEIAKETPKIQVSLDDKEVEEAIKWVQKSRAKLDDLDSPAKKGDFVQIEYQSPQVDNNRKVSDGFLLGEGKLLKGFEEKLENMKPDEEKEFKTTFPSGYFRKDLADKEVDFKVKMEKVQKMTLPELNDEFAQSIGEFKTVQELKDNVKKGITAEKQNEETGKWRGSVLAKIVEKVNVELPEVLVETEQKNGLQELKAKVENELKIEFEEYLKQVNKKEDEIEKDILEQAKIKVKSFLVINQIGKQEKIEVTPQEIEQAIEGFMESSPQQDKTNIDNDRLKGYYKEMIFNQKVFQKLESFCDK
ncbi:MAG: trigger factor [Parcubacteria group bacterium]|nr:trigger factor [Parcubacteria group bacterium]